MKTADEWLDQYGQSHQNPTNKLIHWFCIPLIVMSLMGILISIPMPFGPDWLDPAVVLIAFSLGFYALISMRLAVGMLVVASALYLGALSLEALPLPLWLSSTLVFVLAWVAQFIGHHIEGKKPSFLEDVQFLMIGPLWLLGFVYRRVGIRY
ncbi:MAG: Mpo1-like protein [Myxococcota bacterium]